MEKFFGIYYALCIIWYIACIGMMIYLYFNDSKPYISSFKEKIYPKLPSNLNPGELSNLMYKKIVPEVFTATILVLVKKGVLTLRRTKTDFIISLNKIEPQLSHSQQVVRNILINDMGNGEQVTFKQIEKYCHSNHSCSEFLLNYQIWSKMMVKESNKKRFYEDKTEYTQVKSMRILGIILFLLNILLGYHSLLGYFILIPAIFIVIYFYKIYKRTETANIEYEKWLAFKRYLENIENYNYDKKETASYLIYALILKMPNLESKLTDFICIEKLNNLINHNIVIANLKGNRNFKS